MKSSRQSAGDAHRRGHQHGDSVHAAALEPTRRAFRHRASPRDRDSDGARSQMAGRDRSARGARPTRLVDTGSRLDGRRLGLQDALRQLRVRAEAAAASTASVLSARRRGRRRRGLVVSREYRRSCCPTPRRLGGRAVVEHVHTRSTQSAEASRRAVGPILLQVRRCMARRWFKTCP